MKKYIFLVLITLFLCGCSKNSAKIEMSSKTYEQDGCKAALQIPELCAHSDFADRFNSDYTAFCDNMLNGFLAEAEKSSIKNDSLTLDQKITLNRGDIVSIVGECHSYTGGVHDNLSRIVKNIDIKNERLIAFDDLFCDDGYITRINSYIEVLSEQKPEKFSELWKKPIVTKEQKFYLTPESLVIFFDPYELSYYAKGFVEIEIPYDEITSFLNPEYSGRIIKAF